MPEKERATPVVDLNELALEDEGRLVIDPDADAFAFPPPPPDGRHLAKLGVFKSDKVPTGFTRGKDKRGRPYAMAQLQAVVAAEGKPWDERRVFDRPSTIVMASSGTCAIAGVLKVLGQRVPGNTSIKELAQLLQMNLEGDPLVGIETQWIASYEDPAVLDEQGNPKWVVLKRGMRNFPERRDAEGNVVPGEYLPFVENPKTGERVPAQARIVRYFPASEYSEE